MAVIRINAATGFKYATALAVNGGNTVSNSINRNPTVPVNTGLFNTASLNDGMPSFSVSGTINQSGTLLFENTTNGGALGDVTAVNRGPGVVYVGFNRRDNLSSQSGTIPLQSGESYNTGSQFISEVFANCTAGQSGVLELQGLYIVDFSKVY